MKKKELRKQLIKACYTVFQITPEKSVGDKRLDLFMDIINQHVKEVIGDDETRTKYGAIRCARCMAIPDMPNQKHCVDFVNDEKADQRKRAGLNGEK